MVQENTNNLGLNRILASQNQDITYGVKVDMLKNFMEDTLNLVHELRSEGLEIDIDQRDYPDERLFFTFPFYAQGDNTEKCDNVAICFGVDAKTMNYQAGKINLGIVVENNNKTKYIKLEQIDRKDINELITKLSKQIKGYQKFEKGKFDFKGAFRNLNNIVIDHFENKDNFALNIESSDISEYPLFDTNITSNKDNLKDINWLKENFSSNENKDVDQSGEELFHTNIGGKDFVFLQSGDMFFLMNNTPTIDLLNSAIEVGYVSQEEKERFLSMDEEIKAIQKTKKQYVDEGQITGKDKNLRSGDFWKNAKANYKYDPIRGLWYLDIGGEPVMDEFEKGYIRMLGKNAAKYGGCVLEIGFGMGISAGAIQEILEKKQKEGVASCHIIIEYNHEVAEKAREWAKRQKVPVVILEGDWKDEIKKIPNNILSGALSDPYPLSPEEKHKDAALALGEIHRCLRPGGISVHYSDSQYCLSDEHYKIAKDANFKWIGAMTSSFGGHQNTGEYYARNLRMAVPCLYKSGGTGDDKVKDITQTNINIKDIIEKVFVDNPSEFLANNSVIPRL